MFRHIRKSHLIKYQLYGFSVFILLLSVSWLVTTIHIEEQRQLNASTHVAMENIRILAKLAEIVRNRTRLSHQILLTDDVFKKDEISSKMSAQAGEFVLHMSKLDPLKLGEEERAILDSQRSLYKQVSQYLERITELALEDTQETNQQARNIIVHKMFPLQGKVSDGFARIMNLIEEKVHSDSAALAIKHQKNQKTRLILLLFIISTAVVTTFIVVRGALSAENQLRDLSIIDTLTGISNRRYFNQKTRELWKTASRTKTPLSILFIDIDHFKKYNDYYGHLEGDNCLIKIANIVRQTVYRSEDIVARYGGEEFIAILSNVDKPGAKIVAERLLEQVRNANIPHQQSDTEKYVTISIGYTSTVPKHGDFVDTFIKTADDGLYESKKTGRNTASYIEFSNKYSATT